MPKITAPDHPVHIATTAGVSLHLKARETREVASHIAMAAAQHGCSVDYGKDKAPAPVAFDPRRVEAAVRAIIDEGKASDLTVSGRPKTTAVSERLGVEVSAAEVQRAFEEVTHGNGASAT